jgi:TPR repeat protein
MANSLKTAQFLIESRLRDAARGDRNACFDLGIFYSTGTGGEAIDLVEAHKWFNLAAVHGSEEAQMCRAEVAETMSAREIAEAQRQARAWLSASERRAA